MIVFLVANQKKRYEGVIRPFCNFAKGLIGKEDFCFALLNCGFNLIEYLKTNFEAPVIVCNSQAELVTKLVKLKPKFVIGDDDFSRLKLLNTIKSKIRNVKVVAYVQILYGSHAICRNFDLTPLALKERMLFNLSGFIPFRILTRRYVMKLRNCDFVIANSKATATFLQIFYGMDVNGIVYPPVDMELFKPALASSSPKSVTLYVGSHAGDTPLRFTYAVAKNALRLGYDVNIFGNVVIASAIKGKYPEVNYHKDLEDRKLAELYSRGIITICPQKWETFGYVEVESMACGVPVLTFDCMGVQETVLDGKTGWLAKNKQEFLNILRSKLKSGEIKLDRYLIRKHVEQKFSIKESVKELVKVLGIDKLPESYTWRSKDD